MTESGPPAGFEIDVRREDGTVVVAPRGELDLATVGEARAALERFAPEGGVLVLDLRGVSFLDTSGLRLVLEANERARAGGYGLRLVRGPEPVRRLFEVAGLDGDLPWVDDPGDVT